MSIYILITGEQYTKFESVMEKAGFKIENVANYEAYIDWLLRFGEQALLHNNSSTHHHSKMQEIQKATPNCQTCQKEQCICDSDRSVKSGTGAKHHSVECPVCQCAITRVNMRKHLRKKHKSNPDLYDIKMLKVCNQQRIERNIMKQNYRCVICQKTFELKSSVKRHMKEMHESKTVMNRKNDNSMASYCCAACKMYFKCFFLLLEHNNQEHSELICASGQFKCGICKVSCKSRLELKIHGCYSLGLCSCTQCAKIEKYECTMCCKQYWSRSQLKKHEIDNHQLNKNQLVCDKCGKHFAHRSSLARHKLSHSSNSLMQFLCKICDRQFATASTYKEHKETHDNKFKHLCSICGRRYNTHRALHWHNKTCHRDAVNVAADVEERVAEVEVAVRPPDCSEQQRVESVIARAGTLPAQPSQSGITNVVSVIQAPHVYQGGVWTRVEVDRMTPDPPE